MYYCVNGNQTRSYNIYRASEENFQSEKIYEGSEYTFCLTKDSIISYEYINSEKYEGYRIFEISKDGENKKVLLENEKQEIYRFTGYKSNIYFTASEDTSAPLRLYKLSVDSGKLTLLTPEDNVESFAVYSKGIVYTVDDEYDTACCKIDFNGKNKKKFDISEFGQWINLESINVIDDVLYIVWSTANDLHEIRLSSIDINTGEIKNIRNDIFFESHLYVFDKKLYEDNLIEGTFRELEY